MTPKQVILAQHGKHYRKRLGFNSKSAAKDFFGAKDISPAIDLVYLNHLNMRLREIVDRLDASVTPKVRPRDSEAFKKRHIDRVFEQMQKNGIVGALNNLGRRREQVYFSWMRGYLISRYFLPSVGHIFDLDQAKIRFIGDDDFTKLETFKKTPKADLEVHLDGAKRLRIEVQSGFTGVNDIKRHKVLEAKHAFSKEHIESLVIHFDLHNGRAAFVRLDTMSETGVHWVHRQQMEGQLVFEIPQKDFVWDIAKDPPRYYALNLANNHG